MSLVQVQVNDDAYKVGQELVAFTKTVNDAAKDGVQLTDLFAIAQSAMQSLLPAIAEFQKVKDAAKSDPHGVARAGALVGDQLASVLLG